MGQLEAGCCGFLALDWGPALSPEMPLRLLGGLGGVSRW